MKREHFTKKTGDVDVNMTRKLIAALDRLNPEQCEAVECLDGPLLVIAGPGTGKTQLLSLRAANILAKRDAAPRNILCLTYTEAGAEAMRKRLIELIDRDAYGIRLPNAVLAIIDIAKNRIR